MLYLLQLLCAYLIFSNFVCSNKDKLVRSVHSGLLRGKIVISEADNSTEFYAFKGIPYAKPPVGELRFKAPLPTEEWNGIRNSTEPAEVCVQLTRRYRVIGSEDCLYLDIYDPITARERKNQFGLLPVMVWIHGGDFVQGNAQSTGPDFLMEKPIVLVTLQYRLNVFGFLSTKDSSAEGNNGLKDQLFALKWVQQNIRSFGGDPDIVTIFGESAGSKAVSYHLISPKSRGYFHKAIGQSGTSLSISGFQKNPIQMAFRLGKGLGIKTSNSKDLIKHLRTIGYRKLILASVLPLVVGPYIPVYGFPFLPSLERESSTAFLTKSMYESLKKGSYSKVPYLLGFNTEEGSHSYSYVRSGNVNLNIYEKYPELLIPISMNIKKGSKCADDVVTRIKEFYFKDGNVTNGSEWSSFMSQEIYVRGISKSVDFTFKHIPTYFYKFTYIGQYQLGFIVGGVGHYGEMQYLWYRTDLITTPISREQDLLISKRMVTMWTNFARTGNPTPGADELLQRITWPKVGKKKHCLLIANDLSVIEDPNKNDDDFWDKLFKNCGNPPYITY